MNSNPRTQLNPPKREKQTTSTLDELLGILRTTHPEIFGLIGSSVKSVDDILTHSRGGWIIGSDGTEYRDTPHSRSLVHLATTIKNNLPPPMEGLVRLWRGNRIGEVGLNPSYTNSLEGIALPFLMAYRGPLSYVDITKEQSELYLCHGAVAPDSEFMLPAEIVKNAQIVGMSEEESNIIKSESKPEPPSSGLNNWISISG